MDKNEYISKAINLPKDTNTYQQLDQDPTKMTTTRINKILKTLKETKKLDAITYQLIRPSDASIARFYGLPKIHKPNTPLRPIVSLSGSPTNQVSKFLSKLLSPQVKSSPYMTGNVNTFLDQIQNFRISTDETMVSSFYSHPSHAQLVSPLQTAYSAKMNLGNRKPTLTNVTF